MAINSGLGMAQSYYANTANAFAPAPKLEGAREADVCVIGGGYTGLSAALHLAERGYAVVLLEAGRIGWGASGRNGGQMIPGLRKGASDLIKIYGEAKARMLFDLALEGRSLVVDRVQQHNIACDLTLNGHLLAGVKANDVAWMEEEVEALQRAMNYPHASVLTPSETRERLNSPIYHHSLLDSLGGHLHPLNYALGLAEAARSAGAALFEQSRAISIEEGARTMVRTEGASVSAKHVVLACDALLGHLEPRIGNHIMPVASYMIATAPLKNPNALIANNLAVSDSKFVVNYFRLSADNRLIFAGGERYTPDPPADIAAFVRPFMLKVFPQLAAARIDYAWGGLVSISMSRLPHVGRMGETYFAHGYSGQGVLIASLAGKLIAEAMAGQAERFELMASVAPPEFPGGAALRAPLHVLGMLYYALRDRL